jgi:hypothetical protein
MRSALLLALVAPLAAPFVASQGDDDTPNQDALAQEAQRELVAAFEAAGIGFDPDHGAVWLPAQVAVTNDLLEYVLTAPHGAAHETLFVTGVDPELLNTALLALGVEPGRSAEWVKKDPPPSVEDVKAGTPASEVVPPSGDGFHLYAAWREGDETYLYRVEDLVRDLDRGRTLRRHRFVYTGSRLMRRGDEDLFAASAEGNLVNLSFFTAGNTIVCGADPDCIKQTVWLANAWLLPESGSEVRLYFVREPLDLVPDHVDRDLPTHPEPPRR